MILHVNEEWVVSGRSRHTRLFSLSLSTIKSQVCVHLAYWSLPGRSRQSIVLTRNGGAGNWTFGMQFNTVYRIRHQFVFRPPLAKGWMIPPRISVRSRYAENDKVADVDEKGPCSFSLVAIDVVAKYCSSQGGICQLKIKPSK
jgi:hypothetical protein